MAECDLKTNYGWEKDNFVQVGESMNELTVTITLDEYRELIRTTERLTLEIEKTRADLDHAVNKASSAIDYILYLCPDVKAKLSDIADGILSKMKGGVSE